MLSKKRKVIADINMVPYIDVMLVLLVIFMVTAPFSIKGIQLDLPTSSAQNIPANKKNSFIISISKLGKYSIAYAKQSYSTIKISKVLQIAKRTFKAHPDIKILISGDKKSDYVYLIYLLDALQKIGINNIGFITLPNIAKPV